MAVWLRFAVCGGKWDSVTVVARLDFSTNGCVRDYCHPYFPSFRIFVISWLTHSLTYERTWMPTFT